MIAPMPLEASRRFASTLQSTSGPWEVAHRALAK
jgi:hypothetical protein